LSSNPASAPGIAPVVRAEADSAFKVNNFDLLRILAALQVVYFHSIAHLGIRPGPLDRWIELFPGVPVFFALSGYLISASFERSRDLRSYVRNRLLRILPALYCVVIVTVVVAACFGVDFRTPRAVVWFVAQLAGLIYTPGFLRSFGFGSYNGALWTIPIELQFYLVLPILYATAPRRRLTAWLAGAFAVFAVVAYVYALRTPPMAEVAAEPIAHKLFRYSFLPHIFLFLTGVLLQRGKAHASRWIAGKGLWWLAAYVASTFLPLPNAVGYVFGKVLMAVTVISLAFTARTLARRVLRGNDISYGVYIYHGLVINILLELGCRERPVWLPVVFALTLVLGYVSWVFVERPFLRRKKNSLHPAGAQPAA
jgi:peptidoglycan/LPS O-acetylase OafA/YrhL